MDEILKAAIEVPKVVIEANEGVPARTVLWIIVQEMMRMYEVSREVEDDGS